MSDLDFPSPQVGWLVGIDGPAGSNSTKGIILGSTDGGSSWHQQWRGSAEPFEITSIDPEHAWALASPECASGQLGEACASTVLGTTDGGTTWSQLATIPSGLDQVAFSSSTLGVARASLSTCHQPAGAGTPSCPGAVLVTTDGGAAWTVVLRTPDPVLAVTATAGELIAVEADVTSYEAARANLTLVVSLDQGRSWSTAGRLTIPDPLSLDTTAKLLVQPQGELWLSLIDRESCAMGGCTTVGTWASPDGGSRWSQQLPSTPSYLDDCEDSAPASNLSASPLGTVYGFDEVNSAACSQPIATVISWSAANALTADTGRRVYTFSTFTPTVMSWPSRQLGFAAGSSGLVRTTDGGLSWAQVFPALAPVDAIDAVSAKVAFGAGDVSFSTAVLGTTDGGHRWRVLADLPNQVGLLDFLSAEKGYAVVNSETSEPLGKGAIYETEDGGLEWKNVGSGPPHSGGALIGLTIFPNGSGVTVAEAEIKVPSCALWTTANGGVSWSRRGRIPSQRGYGCAVQAASFISASGKPGPGAIVEVSTHPVRETTDVGKTWSKAPRQPGLGGIQVLRPTLQIGWAESFGRSSGGERLILWESRNGGHTWSSPDRKGQLLPAGSNSGSPVTLSFTSSQVGWLMASGSVWRTLDGGRNWLPAAASSTS